MQSALEAMAFLVVAVAHVPVLLLMHQADGDEADRRFLARRQAVNIAITGDTTAADFVKADDGHGHLQIHAGSRLV